MLNQKLLEYLNHIQTNKLYRTRQSISCTDWRINFSSNDYLSLTTDKRLKKSYQEGFKRYPVGSGGSMVVTGYHHIHQAFERAVAEALQVDTCILFTSGYVANLSVMALLAQLKAQVLLDKNVHASIYDGIRQYGVHYTRCLHQNIQDLQRHLGLVTTDAVVVTESIFSMTGQMAPLVEIAALIHNHYNSVMIVDEAHAFGVIGRAGLGGVVQAQLNQALVPLRIIPFGKAYASFGAIVAGSNIWIEALLQAARPYIYSTALSPAVTYGLLATLDIVMQADERRAHLQALVQYFRDAIQQSAFSWRDSHTPIQQLQLGCPQLALSIAESLRNKGILCIPMRQPTVSKQETGLRVVLNYHHTPEQIDTFFQVLANI